MSSASTSQLRGNVFTFVTAERSLSKRTETFPSEARMRSARSVASLTNSPPTSTSTFKGTNFSYEKARNEAISIIKVILSHVS